MQRNVQIKDYREFNLYCMYTKAIYMQRKDDYEFAQNELISDITIVLNIYMTLIDAIRMLFLDVRHFELQNWIDTQLKAIVETTIVDVKTVKIFINNTMRTLTLSETTAQQNENKKMITNTIPVNNSVLREILLSDFQFKPIASDLQKKI